MQVGLREGKVQAQKLVMWTDILENAELTNAAEPTQSFQFIQTNQYQLQAVFHLISGLNYAKMAITALVYL